jgi:hypothetical protein
MIHSTVTPGNHPLRRQAHSSSARYLLPTGTYICFNDFFVANRCFQPYRRTLRADRRAEVYMKSKFSLLMQI